MDKVQIYYVIMSILGNIVLVYDIGSSEGGVQKVSKTITWLLTNALGLPIAGRILGWW